MAAGPFGPSDDKHYYLYNIRDSQMFDNRKASNHAKTQFDQHSRNETRKDKKPQFYNTFEIPIGNRNLTEAVGNKQKKRDSQAPKNASSKEKEVA